MVKPLTDLTRKGQFEWSVKADIAFENLKIYMSTAPVLKLPDFNKPFIVEIDACYYGLGTVLMHNHHPLEFLSKALGVKNIGLSIYEKGISGYPNGCE